MKFSVLNSSRRKVKPFQSAMSMLNFYLNRAGKNLSQSRRKILEQAKIELRKLENDMNSLQELINYLRDSRILKSGRIEKVLIMVDRRDFVRPDFLENAYADIALPFADDQTISQPTTVVFMLELLDIKPGQKILDIGAGSGWVTCLLAELVGAKGKIYAYEINKKMGELGLENIKKSDYKNIDYKIADANKEWKKYSLYDRIHCAAAFSQIPKDLLNQLKIGGILVAPTQDGYIKKITRISKTKFHEQSFFGFSFVPFIDNSSKKCNNRF